LWNERGRMLLDNYFKLAKKNKKRIFLPSGAICGIDGIKA